MKDFAEKLYKGKAWQRVRAQFIADRISEDGGMCQRCHVKVGLIAHHTVMLTEENVNDPEIALNPALLEFVCLDCHNREPGHFLEKAPRRCFFDDEGNVIDCR